VRFCSWCSMLSSSREKFITKCHHNGEDVIREQNTLQNFGGEMMGQPADSILGYRPKVPGQRLSLSATLSFTEFGLRS